MFICNDVIGPKLFIFVNIHNLYVSMKSSSTETVANKLAQFPLRYIV